MNTNIVPWFTMFIFLIVNVVIVEVLSDLPADIKTCLTNKSMCGFTPFTVISSTNMFL